MTIYADRNKKFLGYGKENHYVKVMLSFGKKITLSHFLVFLVLSVCVTPVVKLIVNRGMRVSMFEMTEDMIKKLQAKPNLEAMIELMKSDPEFTFRPSSLLDAQGMVLFHNYIPNFDEETIQKTQSSEPEVRSAIDVGYGFEKHISPFYNHVYYFVAIRFNANSETYILHVNFTSFLIDRVINWYDIAMLFLCVLFIATTTIANSSIVQIILRPLQHIIDTLKPYEQGKEEVLPEIILPQSEKTGEFGKLATIFNSLRTRIKNEKDFIINSSHELRTPVTVIRGFAETLQDIPDLSKEKVKEITEKIVRTCVRLDQIVRSLMILSDIEHLSPKKRESADLIQITKNCIDQLLDLHPKIRAYLKTNLKTAPILADIGLIEMAITNILENAVKYAKDEPQIEIQIEIVDQKIHLSIEDKGIGISEEHLAHIFDRFFTVDKARSRKSGGAGLGLSIVKNIIEKHGGTIYATSKLGKGTTFTIVLPIKN